MSLSVAMSTPLLNVSMPEKTECFCLPYLLTIIPFSNGQGKLPLLFLNPEDIANASGVSL